MDTKQLAAWLRTLPSMPSRRGVLAGLASGLLQLACGGPNAAARHNHHKHRKKHKKKHHHQALPPSPPSPPPVVCPSVCPVCQTCNVTTGLCEAPASRNGQPGQDCASPRVCCSGLCCDPIHACNATGVCATCAEVCAANCTLCATLADGGTACASTFVAFCGQR